MRFALARALGFGVVLSALSAGCSTESDDTKSPGTKPQVGKFTGIYEVPVTPELADAARYGVAEVEWKVLDGVATLEYDLPLGLVGVPLRVEFTGPLDAAAGTAALTGPAGTADCTLTGTSISCHEVMRGLMPLSPDYAVIAAAAAAEYPGPADHRVQVSQTFAADPIGIVTFDTTNVALEPEDDHPDDEIETEDD